MTTLFIRWMFARAAYWLIVNAPTLIAIAFGSLVVAMVTDPWRIALGITIVSCAMLSILFLVKLLQGLHQRDMNYLNMRLFFELRVGLWYA